MQRLLTTLCLTLALLCVSLGRPALAVYLLDYGDSISVIVKDFPQYSYTGEVRPDGQIAIPFVGELPVAGRTTSQVASEVSLVVRRFVRDPLVTVTLTNLRGRSCMVLGEVNNPGRVDLTRPHMTVLDVVGSAGGFTRRAVRDQVVLIHGDGAQAQRYVINLDKMLRFADLTDNIEVQPGDRVQVPETWWPNIENAMQTIQPVVSMIALIVSMLTLYTTISNATQGTAH